MVWLFVAGLLAAGVDGALGMGFGPTASVILLAAGLPPASAAATVNVAKIGSGFSGGLAHWRFGNIDRRLVALLAGPGAMGAAIGAFVLTSVDGDAVRPVLAGLLFAVGLRLWWRFSFGAAPSGAGPDRGAGVGVAIVGATGGCTNGMIGAWGPVVTPYLVHRGIPPRLAIGSANTAEVAVAVVAAGTLLGAGGARIDIVPTLAMLAGGIVAGPAAAWLIGRVPARLAGLGLAGVLLLTQAQVLGLGRLGTVAIVGGLLVGGGSAHRRRRDRGPGADPEGPLGVDVGAARQ